MTGVLDWEELFKVALGKLVDGEVRVALFL